MAKAGRGDAQYMVRFPEGLRDRIKEEAEKHGRSMNTEIVERLEAYDMLRWRMDELAAEKKHLAERLDAREEALANQKMATLDLQKRLQKIADDEQSLAQAQEEIQKKFDDLKSQSSYLESLKAELLELPKERQEIFSDNKDHLTIRLPADLAEKISQAAEFMKRTMEDQAIDTLEKSYLPPRHLK